MKSRNVVQLATTPIEDNDACGSSSWLKTLSGSQAFAAEAGWLPIAMVPKKPLGW
jgi:hypothetical protein